MIGTAHLGVIAAATPRASGGGGAGAHRYWRLYFPNTEPGFNYYVAVAEVEMRATVGGADLCSGGTASASMSSADAYKAFDNDTGTSWAGSSGAGDKWLSYDFGVARNVVQFKITNAGSNFQQGVKLQWSDDDSTWTDATPLMAAAISAAGSSQTYLVAGTKSYWRLYITKLNGWYYANIAELELRGSIGGSDVTSPASPARASPGDASMASAFDDNASTYWRSDFNTTGPYWIWFALGEDVDIAQLMLTSGSAADEAPTDFEVQYSGDGYNWTTKKAVTGETGWSTYQTRTYTL